MKQLLVFRIYLAPVFRLGDLMRLVVFDITSLGHMIMPWCAAFRFGPLAERLFQSFAEPHFLHDCRETSDQPTG